MVQNYILKLNKHFFEQGYSKLKTNNERIFTYLHKAQNNIYIINLLDVSIYPKEQWIYAIRGYEKTVTASFSQGIFNKSFIINVFIGENHIQEHYETLKDLPLKYDEKTISINWFVDIKQETITVPKHHPNKIIGLEKILKQNMPSIESKPEKSKSYQPIKLHKQAHFNVITIGIIALNFIIWLSMSLHGGSQQITNLIQYGANDPILIYRHNEYYRLFTSMFVHIGFDHLAYNCLAIYIFGSRIEPYLGHKKFFLSYIICGFIANFGTTFIQVLGRENIVSAGASGAIFALQGMAIILSYKGRQNLQGLSYYTILLMTIIGIGFGFVYPNVSNVAHILGLIMGLIYGFIYVKNLKE